MAGRILKTNWLRIPGIWARQAREDINYIADFINRLQAAIARGGVNGGVGGVLQFPRQLPNQQWICVADAGGTAVAAGSPYGVQFDTMYGHSGGCQWAVADPMKIVIADDGAWYNLSFVGWVSAGGSSDGYIDVVWESGGGTFLEHCRGMVNPTTSMIPISASGMMRADQMSYYSASKTSREVDIQVQFTGSGSATIYGTAIVTRILTPEDAEATA